LPVLGRCFQRALCPLGSVPRCRRCNVALFLPMAVQNPLNCHLIRRLTRAVLLCVQQGVSPVKTMNAAKCGATIIRPCWNTVEEIVNFTVRLFSQPLKSFPNAYFTHN